MPGRTVPSTGGGSRAPGVTGLARPLRDEADLEPLVERIGAARIVVVGEGSLGTADYHRWRAALTRRLIENGRVDLVAVDGGWHDFSRVHDCVTLRDVTPRAVLDGFFHWPRWRWANEDVCDFLTWLRESNRPATTSGRSVLFTGLDRYELWSSLQEALGDLRRRAPEHLDEAFVATRCFEPYTAGPDWYGGRPPPLVPPEVLERVVRLLVERHRSGDPGGPADPAPAGSAITGAARGRITTPDGGRIAVEDRDRCAADAERYYRQLLAGGVDAWNGRERHLADTLETLLEGLGPDARAVVWADNTHVGDGSHDDLADVGLVTLGQLLRERHRPGEVVLVGAGSHSGRVAAAAAWAGPARTVRLPPARSGSIEDLLHRQLDGEDALLLFTGRLPSAFSEPREHRCVGLVYSPGGEARTGYVAGALGHRYDAFLWLDRTEAVTPVHAFASDGGPDGLDDDTYRYLP